MTYDRVLELFHKSVDTGNFEAICQALPDERLVRPVGRYGFPGQAFGSQYYYLSPALDSSGVLP